MSGVSVTTVLQLAIAAALIGAGIWLQVRGRRIDPNHGSQGAVILIVIGAIVAIHGLGLLEYRPSGSEQ
jgi:hypothetical protein